MGNVYIKFEDTELQGVVPVNAYIADIAARFGFRPDTPCLSEPGFHDCAFRVVEGGNILSKPTSVESEYFASEVNDETTRLGCQVFLKEEGELVIAMEKHEKEETETQEAQEAQDEKSYREAFAKLPLEKKIADLVQLEAITLSETLSYVISSPYTVFDKVMGVFSELGLRKESQEKRSKRPSEHVSDKPDSNGSDDGKAQEKPENKSVKRKKEEDKDEEKDNQ